MTPQFEAWRQQQWQRMEIALEHLIPKDDPAHLSDAMRYGALGAGKRLRGLLVLATSDLVGGQAQAALRAACAVELIHSYSLIHDDMPCMDNDVLRRGKPTAHVAFGQARALLAGDALQALAFEVLTPLESEVPGAMQASLCHLLSRAAGVDGMAGGQAIDLASVGVVLSEQALRQMHERKTGALLRAALDMGIACRDPSLAALSSQGLANLRQFGAAIGLAFQVVDDILDVVADEALLGKTVGKDAATEKPTYVTLMGLEAAQQFASELLASALAALDRCQMTNDAALRELAIALVQREL